MKINITKSIKIAIFIFFIVYCSFGCTQSNKSLKNEPVQEPISNNSNYTTYSPPLKLYVINGSVNIRSGPGKENAAIASEKKGQLIKVYGKKDDWYYTKLKNGKDGYIYGPLLNDVKPRVTSTTSIISSSDTAAATTPAEKTSENNGTQAKPIVPPSPEPPTTTVGLEPGTPKASAGEPSEIRPPDMQAGSAQPASTDPSAQGGAAGTAPVQVASVAKPVVLVTLIEPPEKFMYTVNVSTYRDRTTAEENARGLIAKGYRVFLMPVKMLKGAVGYSLNVDSVFAQEEDAYRSALAFSKKENIGLSIFQVKGDYNFKVRQITAN